MICLVKWNSFILSIFIGLVYYYSHGFNCSKFFDVIRIGLNYDGAFSNSGATV
jgi:hypothetical protein